MMNEHSTYNNLKTPPKLFQHPSVLRFMEPVTKLVSNNPSTVPIQAPSGHWQQTPSIVPTKTPIAYPSGHWQLTPSMMPPKTPMASHRELRHQAPFPMPTKTPISYHPTDSSTYIPPPFPIPTQNPSSHFPLPTNKNIRTTPIIPVPTMPLSNHPRHIQATLDQLTRVLKQRIAGNRLQQHNIQPPTISLPPSHSLSRHKSTTSQANHIFDESGKRQTLELLLRGPDNQIWERSASNEFGRLTQGNRFGTKGTDTMEFVSKDKVPQTAKITYASFVCDVRPLKKETHRVRMVVGGDRINYHEDTGSPAASLLETKIIINSVISDASKGARLLTCDLKDFFLATPMERPEYMRIPLKVVPQDIQDQYNLHTKQHKDSIYIKIKKGMYGLKQAARLAYDLLKQRLKPYGYTPDETCPSIWTHNTRKTVFCLCVDDFGVKYFSKDDAEHLLKALHNYKATIDWKGENYCGLKLHWNYQNGWVDIEMPKYIDKTLKKLEHPKPKKPVTAPHKWTIPAYGRKPQFAPIDNTPPLDDKRKRRIQQIVGSLLYYARAIDSTILPALSEISSLQARPTEATEQKTKMLLDYLATNPTAKIRYYASDMILYVDSDAAYLVAPNAKSRIAGYYYLSDLPSKKTRKLNGAIMVECRYLKHVVASAAEAETGGLFHNCQNVIHLRRILTILGHQQIPTPIKTDNSTAAAFINEMIKQKRSKSWDMRYHWIRDQQNQKNITVYWDKGQNNKADYFTKHHNPTHHKRMRPIYLHINNIIQRIGSIS